MIQELKMLGRLEDRKILSNSLEFKSLKPEEKKRPYLHLKIKFEVKSLEIQRFENSIVYLQSQRTTDIKL